MAFRQYPDSIGVIISSGSPYTIDLGGVTPDDDQQLSIYRLQIFKRGMQPNAQMRVNAYVSDVLLGQSQWINVSAIESLYPDTDNFYGWVGFEFSPRYNLNSAAETRFELELDNYAYTEDAIFIGVVLDWPVTMGFNATPGQANASPVALELYGAVR